MKQSSKSNNMMIGQHYRLKRKIGKGSFGEIYEAETVRTHRPVAVKLENKNSPFPQLAYEAKHYSILSGGPGILQVRWFGTTETHNALVIDLLGKSIEDLFIMCGCKLSLKTVLMLADQMLCCLEFIHTKNFIHRDVKPDNFVMGIGNNSNLLYIIDFGLAKKYRDQNTHIHIPYAEGKSITGTARYASVGALRGSEQSRRDDLESLGYVLVYLLKGSLPWMGLDAETKNEKYSKILDLKNSISIDELCSGLPKEFETYLLMIKRLKFTEHPKYSKYRALFRNLFIESGFIYDYKYDWTHYMSNFNHQIPLVKINVNKFAPKKAEKKPELLSNATTGIASKTSVPSGFTIKDPSYDESEDKTLSSSMSDSSEPANETESDFSSDSFI